MDWIVPNNAPKDCIDLAGNGVFCIAFMAKFYANESTIVHANGISRFSIDPNR